MTLNARCDDGFEKVNILAVRKKLKFISKYLIPEDTSKNENVQVGRFQNLISQSEIEFGQLGDLKFFKYINFLQEISTDLK